MKYNFIIPTYNNKVILKNTLEALNFQKGYGINDYEVVLVDDGSTDNTYEYIKDVNKNYKLKYLFLKRSEDSCRAKTRNHGWKNAVGDIVIFIDSDIIVQENYLMELERCFSVNKNIVVIGNRLMLDEQPTYNDIITKNVFKNYYFNDKIFNLLESRYFQCELYSYNVNIHWYPWMHVYSCNMAVPRKYLIKTGGFDENFKQWGVEDIELGYSLFKNGIKVVLNYKLEVFHQYHGVRNDLIIAADKKPGYMKNIDYFLKKHPHAVSIQKRFLYKFFSGEIPLELLHLDTGTVEKYITINFKDKNKLEKLKKAILNILKRDNIVITVNDYVEDTDFDIWAQLNGVRKKSVVRYFPISKRICEETIKKFLNLRKEIRTK